MKNASVLLLVCWKKKSVAIFSCPLPWCLMFLGLWRGFKRRKKKKLWNCSTYFVTKDAKLCNYFFNFIFFLLLCALCTFFFSFFLFLTTNLFVAFRHVLHDLLSVNVKPLSYLIFVLGTHIASSLWMVSAAEGDMEVMVRRKKMN